MSDSHTQYYRYARPEVAKLVPADANRVMDIGCAAGFLGARLKERGVREVWGIELDEAAATEAREQLDQVLTGDVYKLGKTLEDDFFDADVLEHLVHTEAALALARRILTPKGKLVLSLPNNRHWSRVRMLLEGDWAYQDAGIMDRAHLRFFTLRSAIIALRAAGFIVEHAASINLSAPPPGFTEQLEAVMGKVLIRTRGLAQELAMCQILFVCSKTPEE